MSHKVLITLTSPRCGTVFLYNLFKGAFGDAIECHHETLSHRELKYRRFFHCVEEGRQIAALDDPKIRGFINNIKETRNRKPVLIFGNSISHLTPLILREIGDDVVILFLHRDVLEVSSSIYVMENPKWWKSIPCYENDYYGNKILPTDPYVHFPGFRSLWGEMNLFEKLTYQILERTMLCVKMKDIYNKSVSIEIPSKEIFSNLDCLQPIVDTMDLPNIDFNSINSPKNKTWIRNREIKPLEVDMVERAIEWPELQALAEQLNHATERDVIMSRLQKYTLPHGIGSRIRHRAHYWQFRSAVAKQLRRAGLLSARPLAIGEEP